MSGCIEGNKTKFNKNTLTKFKQYSKMEII
uniref:Uncharacterized protein n=1 Tax=Siphoviridae sp. ctzCL6 TaxID=2827978 RepID=A0A8S5S6D3_9CAUD|nr:MAG TPA: hypothetical protein [Siphoviridae sp. ctzCL6]